MQSTRTPISFPEAAILLYSDGDLTPIRWTKVTEALGTRLRGRHLMKQS